jgi:hypothetical protein
VFNAAVTDKDCDPSKEEAKHIASYVPRWGVWLAADVEESKAWEIYRERQKRFASLIGDREPIVRLDKFPAWAGRSATSSPSPTIIAPRSTRYARNSTPPAPLAMCCGIVAVIESGWPPVFDLLRYRQHDPAAVLCPYWIHRASPRTDEEERLWRRAPASRRASGLTLPHGLSIGRPFREVAQCHASVCGRS